MNTNMMSLNREISRYARLTYQGSKKSKSRKKRSKRKSKGRKRR